MPIDTTVTIVEQIVPLALPDGAGLAYASGDVRHISPEDPLDSVSISNATRNLAYRDNLLASTLNEVIGVVNNQENLIGVPAPSSYVPPGQVLVVTNYRIPPGYEARVLDLVVSSNPVGAVLAQILYSANTYGEETGNSALSTYTEATGGTSFYATGEFIFTLTNSGTTGATCTATALVSLRPASAQAGALIGPGVVGEQGPPGPQGPQGVPGIGIPGTPGKVGLNWRGTYNSSSSYAAGDGVNYNFGAGVGVVSYICLVPCTGVAPPLPAAAPSANWDLLNYSAPAPNNLLAPLPYVGSIAAANLFGFFTAPYAGSAMSAQACVRVPPYGGTVTFDLQDAYGNLQGRPLTILSGQYTSGTTFASPITLSAGQSLRGYVTAFTGTANAHDLSYNLFYSSPS